MIGLDPADPLSVDIINAVSDRPHFGTFIESLYILIGGFILAMMVLLIGTFVSTMVANRAESIRENADRYHRGIIIAGSVSVAILVASAAITLIVNHNESKRVENEMNSWLESSSTAVDRTVDWAEDRYGIDLHDYGNKGSIISSIVNADDGTGPQDDVFTLRNPHEHDASAEIHFQYATSDDVSDGLVIIGRDGDELITHLGHDRK